MSPDRIIARAEIFKRRQHCLSLALRLKTLTEARKFIRQHRAVLWNGKADLPNMLDAILGRIANGKERQHSKAAENCLFWRKQLLTDPEFLECRFFETLPTVVHHDLWPFLTVFARRNRDCGSDDKMISREARKLISLLERSGPISTDETRKAMRYTSSQERRTFQGIKKELQSLLIIVAREHSGVENRETLDLWENAMPRNVLSRAEHLDQSEARLRLLEAALTGCVLAPEKNIRRWFAWTYGDLNQTIENLMATKQFLRIERSKIKWIIWRKALNGG